MLHAVFYTPRYEIGDASLILAYSLDSLASKVNTYAPPPDVCSVIPASLIAHRVKEQYIDFAG